MHYIETTPIYTDGPTVSWWLEKPWLQIGTTETIGNHYTRADSRFAPSQWDMSLQRISPVHWVDYISSHMHITFHLINKQRSGESAWTEHPIVSLPFPQTQFEPFSGAQLKMFTSLFNQQSKGQM